jgi:hypothetical protein
MRTPVLVLLMVALPAVGASPSHPPVDEVERIRNLTFLEPVEVVVVPRAELRQVLEAQIAKESPIPVREHMRVLEALFLLTESESGLERLMELYEAQVLAFYDPATRKYTVFDGAPPGAEAAAMMADAVAIHELTHALQDQRFDAGKRIRALEGNWDAQLAYHAVLEGEATLVMLAAIVGKLGIPLEEIAKNEDLVSSMAAVAEMGPGFPDDAPRYFVELLKFPYLAGLEMVLGAWRRGGWDAVSLLHANPPRSSEEVLNPELYFAREQAPDQLPERAPCDAEGALVATPLGEFHWRYLLGTEAGEGWESDCVRAVELEAGIRIEGSSAWESEADAAEFAEALRTLLSDRSAEGEVEITERSVRFSWGAEAPHAAAP